MINEVQDPSIIDIQVPKGFMNVEIPIPLTEEWLLKSEAEKINASMYRHGEFTFQNYTNLTNLLTNNGKAYNGYKVCLNGKYIRVVYYVHEWQNLHYIIKDEELTINEPTKEP